MYVEQRINQCEIDKEMYLWLIMTQFWFIGTMTKYQKLTQIQFLSHCIMHGTLFFTMARTNSHSRNPLLSKCPPSLNTSSSQSGSIALHTSPHRKTHYKPYHWGWRQFRTRRDVCHWQFLLNIIKNLQKLDLI